MPPHGRDDAVEVLLELPGEPALAYPAGPDDRDEPGAALPGGPPDCSRAAVLTMSPATMPWFVAPSVTAASPVSTPARSWIAGPRLRTASTRSSAARTARSASSSRAVGAPHIAITASPMNFS